MLYIKRYACVVKLFLFTGHSYLIGEWLAEDPRTNTIKTLIEKEIYTTPSHFIENSTLKREQDLDDLYILSRNIKKHALAIAITHFKRIQFPMRFLLIYSL